ncbi:MAG: chorismate synthase [Anaerorhabdus sp.]
MKSIMGDCLRISLFGESHNEYCGIVIDNFPCGQEINLSKIQNHMDKRKSFSSLSTARFEEDKVKIVSGVFNGYTTGAPICLMIENKNVDSGKYEKIKDIARPSHVDYVANKRFNGFNDYRGSGHFSGRLTAPIVAAGSFAREILEKENIIIGSHVFSILNIFDNKLESNQEAILKQLNTVRNDQFPVFNKDIKDEFEKIILNAKEKKDSVGGVIEVVALNLPVGIGEPLFDTLEGKISNAMFSIGGVKGIEFGLGFAYGYRHGSEVNDEMSYQGNDLCYSANNNGGIIGGMSNGNTLKFKVVIKPTSSIGKTQKSFNMKTLENTDLTIDGFHDPAIIYRSSIVIESMLALVLLDAIMQMKSSDKL